MKQCNICGNYRCRIVDGAFPKWRTKHFLTAEEMQMNCKRYVPLESLKVKLLELCLSDFPSLEKVLRKLKFKVIPDGDTIQVVNA